MPSGNQGLACREAVSPTWTIWDRSVSELVFKVKRFWNKAEISAKFPVNFLSEIMHLGAFLGYLRANQTLLVSGPF